MRLCTKCGQFKPPSEFGKTRNGPDGLQRWCKECWHEYNRRPEVRARMRKRRQQSKFKMQIRKGNLRRHYGITPEEYDRLFDTQGGKCAICGELPRRLVVDHNHETGKVRGLLCFKCNNALLGGVEWLKAAIAYLERSND